MSFNVTCSPGKDAAAGYLRVTEHLPALVLYLDPVNMAIQLPPFPGGEALLAKFCRELAREATKLAGDIEPVAGPTRPVDTKPRHARNDEDASGHV